MAGADFFEVRCTGNGSKLCNVCTRTFGMKVSSSGTVTADKENKAVIQTADHAFFHPLCGSQARSIHTTITFDKVVKLLDGKLENLGNVDMQYYKDVVDPVI